MKQKKQFINLFGIGEQEIEKMKSTPDYCKLTLSFDIYSETRFRIPYLKFKESFENYDEEIFFENRKNLKYMIKTIIKNFMKRNGNDINVLLNKYKRIIKKEDGNYYLINTCLLNETMIYLAYGAISCASLISKSKIQRKLNNLLIYNNIGDIYSIDLEKRLKILSENQNLINDLKDMAIDVNNMITDEIKTIYYRFNTILMDISIKKYANDKEDLPVNVICNNITAIDYVKRSDLDTLLKYISGNYFSNFLQTDET